MKRRLFNALAAISLLLCLATAVLWVLNISFREEITYWSPYNAADRCWFVTVMIDSDGVSPSYHNYHWVDPRKKPPSGSQWRFAVERYPAGVGGELSFIRPSYRLLGFAWSRRLNINGYQGILVAISDRYTFTAPYWSLLLVSAAGVIWTYKKRQQPKGNFCSKCNYDLRATPDRCPECGEVPKNTEAKV